MEGDVFCVGSGGTLAYGVLDGCFRELIVKKANDSTALGPNDRSEDRNMTVDDAVSLAVKAIRHATHRDSFSGGYINVFHLNESGAVHVYREDSRQIELL